MGLRWQGTAVDAGDPARLARWWAEVLHFQILEERPDAVSIAPDQGEYPGMMFVRAPDAKVGRNRLPLELDSEDLVSDIERLMDMGARHVPAQPAGAGWTLLADPEGNEFRLFPPRP
ncbi:glyoxalase [Catellatospora sp. IY07-71]|uniref:VOC family protein n=1 Tax=Catellatospora sp. IY07-71 TaxID=2728827 RepID=UPI001BB43954|nr:VOC family protein [Catellatospora sp. IY07-71]BCJ78148.1 glyoxalase [Catellatospora sp. IY07-71]